MQAYRWFATLQVGLNQPGQSIIVGLMQASLHAPTIILNASLGHGNDTAIPKLDNAWAKHKCIIFDNHSLILASTAY